MTPIPETLIDNWIDIWEGRMNEEFLSGCCDCPTFMCFRLLLTDWDKLKMDALKDLKGILKRKDAAAFLPSASEEFRRCLHIKRADVDLKARTVDVVCSYPLDHLTDSDDATLGGLEYLLQETTKDIARFPAEPTLLVSLDYDFRNTRMVTHNNPPSLYGTKETPILGDGTYFWQPWKFEEPKLLEELLMFSRGRLPYSMGDSDTDALRLFLCHLYPGYYRETLKR